MKTFRRNQKLQRMRVKELSSSQRSIEEKPQMEAPPIDDEHVLARTSSERLETGAGSLSPSASVASGGGGEIVFRTVGSEKGLDSTVHSMLILHVLARTV